MRESAYQLITGRIILLLQGGSVPWRKPWKTQSHLPRNLISKREYRGINIFLLLAMGYESPYWATFNQVRELGGSVRKDEKSSLVVFWKWLEVEEGAEKKRIPLLRYYCVFNAQQCEGIDQYLPKPQTPVIACSPIEAAERIVAGMPRRPLIEHGQRRAFYSPLRDMVGMPSRERFVGTEDYYSTLFHKLTHATGHESRLNRRGVAGERHFGSEPYSKEELVAEMGSCFLCGQAGIVERTIDNSAAYLNGWLRSLKHDATLVVQAAAQAQRAADFIMGKQAEESEVGNDTSAQVTNSSCPTSEAPSPATVERSTPSETTHAMKGEMS